MPDVNEKQIGGDHYRSPIQHWDFVEINGLGYLEGCATKYATRNRKKHESPVLDLDKAIHYCEKLLSLHEQGLRYNRRIIARGDYSDCIMTELQISVGDFAAANALTTQETEVVQLLADWVVREDLQKAIVIIEHMRDRALILEDAEEEGSPQ